MSSSDIPLFNPAVRDLAWVMESPGMLDPLDPAHQGRVVSDEECTVHLERARPALKALDEEPAPLLRFIEANRRSGRLGNHFESLLHFWMRELIGEPGGMTNVHAGVAVRRGQDTLGEMDFVFESSGSHETGGAGLGARIVHWEAAVKFYMRISDEPRLKSFVGQRLLDRLDLKLERSLNHQLSMPGLPEAREKLRELGFTDMPRGALFMKGRLFYPSRPAGNPAPLPGGLSPRHERGWWGAFDPAGLSLPGADSRARWLILPKPRWLSRALADEGQLLDPAGLSRALEEHFDGSDNAIQVACLLPARHGGARFWEEIDMRDGGPGRGMILRAGWPACEMLGSSS